MRRGKEWEREAEREKEKQKGLKRMIEFQLSECLINCFVRLDVTRPRKYVHSHTIRTLQKSYNTNISKGQAFGHRRQVLMVQGWGQKHTTQNQLQIKQYSKKYRPIMANCHEHNFTMTIGP